MTSRGRPIRSIENVSHTIETVIDPLGRHESVDVSDVVEALFVWPRHILRIDDVDILRAAACRLDPGWHDGAVSPLLMGLRLPGCTKKDKRENPRENVAEHATRLWGKAKAHRSSQRIPSRAGRDDDGDGT